MSQRYDSANQIRFIRSGADPDGEGPWLIILFARDKRFITETQHLFPYKQRGNSKRRMSGAGHRPTLCSLNVTNSP